MKYTAKQLEDIYPNCEFVGTDYLIGKEVLIGSFSNLRAGYDGSGFIEIGDYTKIAQLCTITTHNHNYKDKGKFIMDQGIIHKAIKIGMDVWIGANSVVLPGRTIGNGAVIGAGSVVNKDIPSYEVWAGNPIKKIGERT